MKKLVTLLAAAMLMFSLSGQAMAFFENEHLIRVVYSSSKEIATDLGTGWDISSPYGGNNVFSTNTFSLADLGVTDWSSVNVAYFIVETDMWDGMTSNQIWASGPESGQSNSRGMYDAFLGQAGKFQGFNLLKGSAHNIYDVSEANAYRNVLDPAGSFAGFLQVYNGEASLAAFDGGATSVDQYLYYYGSPDDAGSGVKVIKLTTNLNGTTTAGSPSAVVPVPAAVYLLGSGLLGLVGIRRRMAA
jgi:hypothetical protein